MSISITTNFKVNSDSPIDSRLIATGPDGLTNMEYKYEGLTVYRTDTGYSYTWDGDTWNLVSDGIYGGSGSLIGDTYVDQGFVGPTAGDMTNDFILSASSSEEIFNYSSKFIRNGSNDVEFKNSLLFGTFSGPYISFNPTYMQSRGRGGISIGTGDDFNYLVSEKLRIQNDGLIKIKPLDTLTASLNIFYEVEDVIFGYNWYSIKDDTSVGSSFLKFANQKLSINHVATNSSIATHSVIFNHPDHIHSVEINGNLSTSGNFYLGVGNGFNHVSFNNIGLGIDYNNNEVSLFNNNITKGVVISNRTVNLGNTNYTVNTDSGSTFSTLGFFAASYKTNVWDNTFNVDRVNNPDTTLLDNFWTRNVIPSDSFNDTSSGDSVEVILASGTYSQDSKFIFRPGSYTAKNSISSWTNERKPYDRMFYFYNGVSDYHIIHDLSWYLSNDSQTAWKQIGHLETGNQNSYNQEILATSSYATRYYSQSVLVPADMDFKIKFAFPFEYSLSLATATSSLPYFVVTSIRSGKWRTEYSDSSISNL